MKTRLSLESKDYKNAVDLGYHDHEIDMYAVVRIFNDDTPEMVVDKLKAFMLGIESLYNNNKGHGFCFKDSQIQNKVASL